MIKIIRKPKELDHGSNNEEINDYSLKNNAKESAFLNTVAELDKKIEEIEKKNIEDEFFFSNIENQNNIEKNNTEINTLPHIVDDLELFEIIEQDKDIQLTANNVDKLDDNIANMKEHIVDNAVYQEYKTEVATDVAIAFGGREQKEGSTQGKEEENKCSRCGSSLIGANGFCPGCGAQL